MANPDLSQAASDIKWLGARFKGLLAAADALDKLGSIQNAAAEAQARIDDLAKQEEAAKVKALQIIADAKGQAASIAAAATAEYQQHISTAQAQATDIVAEANRVLSEHADKKAELASIEAVIADKTAQLQSWDNKIAAAQAQHVAIQGMLAELKAKIGGAA